uniref:Vesicle transport protein n=1 Tax=Alexandrium andersonii TaxID=327968 RepID=A0A7S2MY55_9DINO
MLFAFGSMTLLSSFAILKGPQAFGESLIQREKLPFSGAYVVGLVGTLVATIVMRSYILTAVFGLIQAVALLYFLASYVPGGQALLNFCGRCSGRAARAVYRSAT